MSRHGARHAGEGPEAVEEIDVALAGSVTDVEEARLVATRANVLRTWDRAGARPEAERALELGQRAGDVLAEYVASQTLAFCNGFDGYLDDALEIAVRSRRMVSSLVDQFEITPDERVSPALYLVWGIASTRRNG